MRERGGLIRRFGVRLIAAFRKLPAPHAYAWILGALVLLSMGVSLLGGTPKTLPNVALSSTALFHVERAAALLAGLLLVFVVLAHAWQGHLPSEISGRGLKYQFQDTTKQTLDDLTEAIGQERQDREQLVARIESLEGGEGDQ